MPIILQKYIAESGQFSRRQAEELIRAGKVTVDGRPAKLGMKVEGSEDIRIAGKLLKPTAEKKYIILNKPAGYTCTSRKFKGEKNVFELVKCKEKLFVVGRLDKESRGLVLLTNDGDLAYKLTHPKFGHEKEYSVKVRSKKLELRSNYRIPNINEEEVELIIKHLKNGIDVGEGDGATKVKSAEYSGKNVFRLVLTEGKKRQIRRMFAALGYEVEDLFRIRIGNVQLDGLKEGNCKILKKNDFTNYL